jgi:chemotaxis protein MotB
MKLIVSLLSLALLVACVPAKKYNELVEKEKKCSEDLAMYKNSSLDFEGKSKELQEQYTLLTNEVKKLKADTNQLGNTFRVLQTQYDKMAQQNESLEKAFDKLRLAGAKETANLQAELESKNIELQRKEDVLTVLENDLKTKQQLLADREQRVNELEEMIQRKDEATKLLRQKVANALKGFINQGLSVQQKNGKIYVSLEAKLLFASGSTTVEPNGKKALIDLAKVLEREKEVEIIVEGHTDTDKLVSPTHPKSNWELSVLRATSVVNIMISESELNPAQLMAAGRSEFHPLDPADKAKNRRIEIIISPNLSELFEIITNK